MKKNLRLCIGAALALTVCFLVFSCSFQTGSDASSDVPQYNVVYAGNGNTGGSVPVDSKSYAKGASAVIAEKPDALVKSGYYFSSWNTSADSSGTSLAPGATYVMGDSSLTLYAIWSTYSWIVTFDSQSATVAATPSSCVVAYPATRVSSLPTAPTKTGYAFGGWWTGKSGAGSEFTASTTVSANVTVYAKWTADAVTPSTPTIPSDPSGTVTYTVSYSADDGATMYSSASVSSGSTVSSLPTAPAKSGYAFGGWWTGKSGTGSEFTASTTVTSSVTVYAKWTAVSSGGSGSGTISATVSIPGDGSITFSPSMLTVQKGNTLTVSVIESGYSSYEWYIDGNDSGTSGTSIVIDSSGFSAGIHELMLSVTDSGGSVSSGSCRFTIKN